MAVAALVLPDRLDKPSLVLAGQPETEVRERRRRCRLPPHPCFVSLLLPTVSAAGVLLVSFTRPASRLQRSILGNLHLALCEIAHCEISKVFLRSVFSMPQNAKQH